MPAERKPLRRRQPPTAATMATEQAAAARQELLHRAMIDMLRCVARIVEMTRNGRYL